MQKISIILLFLILPQLGIGQDTISTNFETFNTIENKYGYYELQDINHKPYKIVVCNGSHEEYVIIGKDKIKLDSSLYYDSYTSYKQIDSVNQSLFLKYYAHNIFSPPHGGDPNFAIVSFTINEHGELLSVRIVKDVMNRGCKGNWEIILNKDFHFEPLIINDTPYIMEYIVKIMDISYCVPIIEKEGTIKKK